MERVHGAGRLGMRVVALMLLFLPQLVGGVAAPVHSARSSFPVVLKGRTSGTISASTGFRVELAEPVHSTSIGMDLRGRGRVLGFALFSERLENDEPARSLLHLQMNRCSEPGCKATGQASVISGSSTVETLEPGIYHLYVLADAAPLEFELKISGLGGRSRLRDGYDPPVEVSTLPVVAELGGNVFSAGAFTGLRSGSGETFLGLWLEGKDHLATAYSECAHRSESLPSQLAFFPGCPLGQTGSLGTTTTSRRPDGRGGVLFTSSWPEMVPGVGAWFTTASQPKTWGAVALWLKYDV